MFIQCVTYREGRVCIRYDASLPVGCSIQARCVMVRGGVPTQHLHTPLPVRYAIPRYLHSAQLTDREVQAEQEAIEPSSAEASPPENTRAAAAAGGGGGGGERASERVCPMALMYTRPPCESHGACI